MNFVVLINGSINSGKTTVSRALCRLHSRLAHVEVDSLHDFIEWMPLAESIPLNLKNAAAVGRNFLEYGLDIVISYPLGPEDYEYLIKQLEPYPIHCFTLCPPIQIAQTNRGDRILTAWEIEKINVHYQNGVSCPEFDTVTIDNSAISPEETAGLILHHVLETK